MMEFWKSEHAVAGIGHWENRHPACSGTTLVELMVATLIGVIVFSCWLSICNPKPVVKESYRRLAVERAAGYLDLVLAQWTGASETRLAVSGGASGYSLATTAGDTVQPMFPDDGDAVVGYVLAIERRPARGGWPEASWACIRLYDVQGGPVAEAGFAFFELSACLR